MKTDYTPLPISNPVPLSEEDIFWMCKAKKGVVFLSLVQLFFAFFVLSHGSLPVMLATTIFAFFGLVGVRKQNVRLLTAHFVYSLILYIFSLIGLVALFIYCENCPWYTYVIVFVFVLIQAIGLRHSRLLIVLIKNNGNSSAIQYRCSWRRRCPAPKTECSSVQTAQTAETQTNAIPMVQISTQTTPSAPEIPQAQLQHPQFAAIQMQNFNGMPTFVPFRYPMQQQGMMMPQQGMMMQQQPMMMPQYMQAVLPQQLRLPQLSPLNNPTSTQQSESNRMGC